MYLIQKHLNVLSIILLILGGLLFSGVLVAGASDRAEDPAPTEESASSDDEVDIQVTEDYCNAYKFNRAAMTEEIFEQAGINVDFTFANVFGGTQKKPKVEDLYLSIYQELKEAPSDTALEETAEANQMTQTELCSILGGNYQLLSTIYSENYSNDDLLEVVEGLQEQYDTVLENEAFKKDLFWETYPQEIFVNGDTEDSGFDVLYDLEIIEYILFGEDSTIGSGGSFGMGDWGDDDEEEEAEDEELDIEPEEPDAEPEDEDSEPTEDEEEGEEES